MFALKRTSGTLMFQRNFAETYKILQEIASEISLAIQQKSFLELRKICSLLARGRVMLEKVSAFHSPENNYYFTIIQFIQVCVKLTSLAITVYAFKAGTNLGVTFVLFHAFITSDSHYSSVSVCFKACHMCLRTT